MDRSGPRQMSLIGFMQAGSTSVYSGSWRHPATEHGFLAAGYFAHGLWDLAHHPHGVQTRVRSWYIPACVVYDWLVAAFVVAYLLC